MKNLLGRLMSRPIDELKAIAVAWGTITRDPNPPQNDLAIAVYHTMVDRSATRGVWSNLDPEARAFLTWLLDQRNMLALADELPARLGQPPDEVATIVERTRRLGLVDVEEALVRGTRVVSSGDNLYAWGARNPTEAVRRRVVSIATESAKVLREVIDESKRPPPFDEPFAALLESLPDEEVQRIASTWRLPEVGRYYKSELVGVMSEFIATNQGREALIRSLPPASQGVLAYLQSEGGRAPAAEVRRHFEWDEREFRTGVVPLLQRGLVWDALSADRRYLFVPADLLDGAGAPSQAQSPAMQPKLEAPAPQGVESRYPYEMPWDLLTLMAAAAQQELPLTLQEGSLTKRLAKKINSSFLHPLDLKSETNYLDAVVHFARSLGLLVEMSGDQPVLALGPKTGEWVSISFEAQRRTLFALWQEDRKWSEPATYGTVYWWNSDLTGARKRLVAHLRELPASEWVSLDAFLRRLHMAEPFIIWSQDELIRRFGLRALQGFRSHWFEIEGRIIADMLRTMLHWLGAVELGRDKQRRFSSFRVTEEGRALFDADRPVERIRPPAKTLLVQPNFEVLVLHPDSGVLWNLLRMADLVRHDRVSAYVLTKESVTRAIESGLAPEAVRRFLDTHTGKSLPQNVAHTVADWAKQVRHASVQRVTLIEVQDASVLDEMMASRKTRRYVGRRLSPTVAIANLPPASDSGRESPWQKLVKDLKAAGYLASYSQEDGDLVAEPSPSAAAATGAAPADGRRRKRGPVSAVPRRRATPARSTASSRLSSRLAEPPADRTGTR